MVDAPDDHQRRTVAEICPERRQVDSAREQVLLLHHVLDRVAGKGFERSTDLESALLGLPPDHDRVQELPARQQLSPSPHLSAPNLHSVTVPAQVEQRVVRQVHEWDARVGEQGGAHVRVVQRRRLSAVKDRRRTGADQVLGRDPVQVGVVDQGDLARLETLHQVLGSPPGPKRTAHGRTRRAGGAEGHGRPSLGSVCLMRDGAVAQPPSVLDRRCIAGLGAQHPHELLDHFLPLEPADLRKRLAIPAGLLDREMP